jgi:beta-fructofuranosidase
MDRRKFLLTSAAAAIAGRASRGALAPRGATAPVPENGLAADPLRPQFHLLPPANWINDPNAPLYWNDKYHMFYQYNPDGAYWGDMHWGHAISIDMVHWKHLPVAVSPTAGGPDADGCFTGTAVVDDGKILVLYTGVVAVPADRATTKGGAQSFRETQCLLTSSDPELKVWTKLDAPVLAEPPTGMEVNGFRDPSPWRLGDWWYMVLGSGVENRGGVVLLYKSRDLLSWEFLQVLAGRKSDGEKNLEPYNPWETWECPELFALGDKHVLIFSTLGRAYWQTGVLDPRTMQFHPEHAGILDYGSYYAPKTQLSKDGRRILWGWIQEARPLEQYKAAGWAGLMSLPRVLALDANGKLMSRAAPEVDTLRDREQSVNVSGDEESVQGQIEALRIEKCCGELQCVARSTAENFGLVLAGSGAISSPWITVQYDRQRPAEISIDARSIPFQLNDGEDFNFEFYIDSSVIELFVNGRVAYTKRFYYLGGRAQDACVKWTGRTKNLVRLSCYRLTPISADRLTT